MANQELGFTRDLYIMPFDHRGSFQEKLFGIKGRIPNEAETADIASYKQIIYDGFLEAVKQGVPKEKAGILADEQFGAAVLKQAHDAGYMTACPAEKSGQEEFDFEYGAEFGAHIAKFNPTFVKVLVRYNPEGDEALNKIQNERLKKLADYCHAHNNKFMFELLVPATKEQLAKVSGDAHRYDKELRPSLMARAMTEIQNDGVEADLWKVEGIETEADCVTIAKLARNTPARKNVGVIILGRGENAEKVKLWLNMAAKVPGFVGFAVGRTIFWEPLKAVKDGKQTREQAVKQVAENYKTFCDLWTKARAH
jgi:myo-inositol catabolism protein IolC